MAQRKKQPSRHRSARMKVSVLTVVTVILSLVGIWIVCDILWFEYQNCETAWDTAADYVNSEYCKPSPITAKIPEHIATCNKYEGAAKVTAGYCFSKKVLVDIIGAKLNPSKDEWINTLINFGLMAGIAYWVYWVRVAAMANDTRLKAYTEMLKWQGEQARHQAETAKQQITFQREQASQKMAMEQQSSFAQQAVLASFAENLTKVASSAAASNNNITKQQIGLEETDLDRMD